MHPIRRDQSGALNSTIKNYIDSNIFHGISLKKPSGNVGTRTCVTSISSQQKCYIPSRFFQWYSMTNIAIYIINNELRYHCSINYSTIKRLNLASKISTPPPTTPVSAGWAPVRLFSSWTAAPSCPSTQTPPQGALPSLYRISWRCKDTCSTKTYQFVILDTQSHDSSMDFSDLLTIRTLNLNLVKIRTLNLNLVKIRTLTLDLIQNINPRIIFFTRSDYSSTFFGFSWLPGEENFVGEGDIFGRGLEGD